MPATQLTRNFACSLCLISFLEGAVSCSADNKVALLSLGPRKQQDGGKEAEEEGAAGLQEAGSLELKSRGASSAPIRPDGKIFAVGGWDNNVWVYDYRKIRPLACLPVSNTQPSCRC